MPQISNKLHGIQYIELYNIKILLELPDSFNDATSTDCLHWIVIGPSWQACSLPPLALPPYMVMTSAQRWSVFVRTWACVLSTMSYLTSWVSRNICGSTPDSKGWLKKTYARRWTSQYKSTASSYFRIISLYWSQYLWPDDGNSYSYITEYCFPFFLPLGTCRTLTVPRYLFSEFSIKAGAFIWNRFLFFSVSK